MNDTEPKGDLLQLLWHTREAFSVRANVSENYSSAMIWRLLTMCATEIVAHLRTDMPLFVDCAREECAVCEPERLTKLEAAVRGLIESETPAPSAHGESESTIPTEERAVWAAHHDRRGGKPGQA